MRAIPVSSPWNYWLSRPSARALGFSPASWYLNGLEADPTKVTSEVGKRFGACCHSIQRASVCHSPHEAYGLFGQGSHKKDTHYVSSSTCSEVSYGRKTLVVVHK